MSQALRLAGLREVLGRRYVTAYDFQSGQTGSTVLTRLRHCFSEQKMDLTLILSLTLACGHSVLLELLVARELRNAGGRDLCGELLTHYASCVTRNVGRRRYGIARVFALYLCVQAALLGHWQALRTMERLLLRRPLDQATVATGNDDILPLMECTVPFTMLVNMCRRRSEVTSAVRAIMAPPGPSIDALRWLLGTLDEFSAWSDCFATQAGTVSATALWAATALNTWLHSAEFDPALAARSRFYDAQQYERRTDAFAAFAVDVLVDRLVLSLPESAVPVQRVLCGAARSSSPVGLRILQAVMAREQQVPAHIVLQTPHLRKCAVMGGELPFVEALHGLMMSTPAAAVPGTEPPITWTAVHMDLAAARGNLELVKWFHSHSPAGCSVSAMDWAASGGHVRVLEFLSETREEGFSLAALDGHSIVPPRRLKSMQRRRPNGRVPPRFQPDATVASALRAIESIPPPPNTDSDETVTTLLDGIEHGAVRFNRTASVRFLLQPRFRDFVCRALTTASPSDNAGTVEVLKRGDIATACSDETVSTFIRVRVRELKAQYSRAKLAFCEAHREVAARPADVQPTTPSADQTPRDSVDIVGLYTDAAAAVGEGGRSNVKLHEWVLWW